MKKLQNTITKLLDIAKKLENEYKDYNRKFTLDGHLLGSIGEVYASKKYKLTLLPSSTKTHDAKDINGNLIQIKVTQTEKIGIRNKPDFLLVLKLKESGEFEEIYYGEGSSPWSLSNPKSINGQKSLTLNKLRNLNE